ncbi:MAG: ABC-type transport auxiliary lipoprotein family protein [Candidatus Pacebacteria bacterium]|nr:ABC-type transport auxiliary lipoprotein family protein [Candidatus Paceibacterota bacterium]
MNGFIWKRCWILLVFLAGGCLGPTTRSTSVSFYDLRTTVTVQTAHPRSSLSVGLGRFLNAGPYNERMVYRKSAHPFVEDDYHRGVQPPEDMMSREPYNAMAKSELLDDVITQGAMDADLYLTANIITFEVDPELNAVIQLAASLRRVDTSETLLSNVYEQKEALAERTPEAFAAAASRAAQRLLTRIVQDCHAAALTIDGLK